MSEARISSDDVRHPTAVETPSTAERAAGSTAPAAKDQPSWEQFVWDAPRSDTTADIRPAAPDIKPKELEIEDDLPRIIAPPTASAPPEATAGDSEGHEEWRRQFISALKEVDGDAPIPAPPLAYAKARAGTAPTLRVNNQRAQDTRQVDAHRMLAPTRMRRAVAGGALALGVFATAALWATYKPDTIGSSDLQTASIATHVNKEAPAASEAPAEPPMVNTPVLVREGEAAPPPPTPDTSAWRRPPPAPAVPPAPRPQASAPVPPLIIHRTVTVHPVPAPDAIRLARPDQRSPGAAAEAQSDRPPLNRAGLTELATRPVALPAPEPRQAASIAPKAASHGTDRPTETRRTKRRLVSTHQKNKRTEGTNRSQPPATPPTTSRSKWERRQGLRTVPQPEPEPSTLKKLLNAVWPGSSTTTPVPAEKAKPIPPAAPAAPAAPPHDWSSKAVASP